MNVTRDTRPHPTFTIKHFWHSLSSLPSQHHSVYLHPCFYFFALTCACTSLIFLRLILAVKHCWPASYSLDRCQVPPRGTEKTQCGKTPLCWISALKSTVNDFRLPSSNTSKPASSAEPTSSRKKPQLVTVPFCSSAVAEKASDFLATSP